MPWALEWAPFGVNPGSFQRKPRPELTRRSVTDIPVTDIPGTRVRLDQLPATDRDVCVNLAI